MVGYEDHRLHMSQENAAVLYQAVQELLNKQSIEEIPYISPECNRLKLTFYIEDVILLPSSKEQARRHGQLWKTNLESFGFLLKTTAFHPPASSNSGLVAIQHSSSVSGQKQNMELDHQGLHQRDKPKQMWDFKVPVSSDIRHSRLNIIASLDKDVGIRINVR
ncbi:hypothetical protein BDB00DRAFT_932602 [Zychaea mexicana]|uniref:uncharacterized protein n=1 Tax=Zychaea mexicana TaxID=64656 RepID=UPI0022FEA885|nr:uncharacterized protein BDB00DRAFT_932602 [Zychaea mexicana]KAI9488584.1 hypothetical protein BDB00DRAFT_932602 [Zychaea mexicana]